MNKDDIKPGQLWALANPTYDVLQVYYTYMFIIDVNHPNTAIISYLDVKADGDSYMPGIMHSLTAYETILNAIARAPYDLVSGPGAEER